MNDNRARQGLLPLVSWHPPAWTKDAACADPDIDRSVFYPEGNGTYAQRAAARDICRRCPVLHSVCIAYGDQVSPQDGIFGGLTWTERRNRRAGAQERGAA